MTNDQIVALVIGDPLVFQRNTQRNADGSTTPPSLAQLEGLAKAALQNEINLLLDTPSIRRSVMEGDHSLTLSDGTSVDQGKYYELPSAIASVLSVTVGDRHKPLEKKTLREDFDRWWHRGAGESSTVEVAQVWTEWGRSSTGKLRILISPGVGDNSTANVHYFRRISQPVQVQALPDDVHYLVELGVRNRMSGDAYRGPYEEAKAIVKRRLEGMVGGASIMPQSKEQENFNCEMSAMVAGVSSTGRRYPWPS